MKKKAFFPLRPSRFENIRRLGLVSKISKKRSSCTRTDLKIKKNITISGGQIRKCLLPLWSEWEKLTVVIHTGAGWVCAVEGVTACERCPQLIPHLCLKGVAIVFILYHLVLLLKRKRSDEYTLLKEGFRWKP